MLRALLLVCVLVFFPVAAYADPSPALDEPALNLAWIWLFVGVAVIMTATAAMVWRRRTDKRDRRPH